MCWHESWGIWGVCMVDLVTHDTGNWPWARRERSFAQIPSISILYVVLFFSAEPYIWGDIYKSWDEFAATKLLRKLLRLGCFWCSESRRKLRKSGVYALPHSINCDGGSLSNCHACVLPWLCLYSHHAWFAYHYVSLHCYSDSAGECNDEALPPRPFWSHLAKVVFT